jgi:hypothetical protein
MNINDTTIPTVIQNGIHSSLGNVKAASPLTFSRVDASAVDVEVAPVVFVMAVISVAWLVGAGHLNAPS